MVDNLFTIVLLSAVFSLSFVIWLLTAYFATIPKEIEEAAMMDGNSRVGAMIRMVLPLSWPGLVAVAIFGFMNGWNEFLFSLTFLRDQNKLPITIGLYKFVARFQVAVAPINGSFLPDHHCCGCPLYAGPETIDPRHGCVG